MPRPCKRPPAIALASLLPCLILLLGACGGTAAPPPAATTAATAAPPAAATATTAPAPATAVRGATTTATRAAATTSMRASTATSTRAAGATPSTNAAAPARQSRIIDRTAGFPRRIQAVNGVVEVKAKPRRIHTLSVGYDEITFRLVEPGRIAAIGQSTADPNLSNVADLAAGVPRRVGRNAEQVLAAEPDLVVASPFADKDLLRQLGDAGITVAVVDLSSAVDGNAENIRLLAYLYGEEERGEALVAEVEGQLARIDAAVARASGGPHPRVLFLQNNAYVSGTGSTGDGIIARAGGINVAAEAGIAGTKQISLESVIAMRPDLIVLSGTPESNPQGFAQVMANPALADVPAVKNGRVAGIKGTYLSTLSHWNVRGIEELVDILYPGTR